MADITPPLPAARQLIQGYGEGGFRIAGQEYAGSVLIEPETTHLWTVRDATAIDLESLSILTGTRSNGQPDGAVLLIGTGRMIEPLDPALRLSLRRFGLGVEIMDTGAACRTFNILLAEERNVIAALIAVV
jgi:uncharacterized protein